MQFLLVLASLAVSALAQRVNVITVPTASEGLPAGKDFTVSLFQIISPTDVVELNAVIGISQCLGGTCTTFDAQRMQTVLYNGPYNPQNFGGASPYENFTVTAPTTTGLYSLVVTHQSLSGATHGTFYEVKNITIPVV